MASRVHDSTYMAKHFPPVVMPERVSRSRNYPLWRRKRTMFFLLVMKKVATRAVFLRHLFLIVFLQVLRFGSDELPQCLCRNSRNGLSGISCIMLTPVLILHLGALLSWILRNLRIDTAQAHIAATTIRYFLFQRGKRMTMDARPCHFFVRTELESPAMSS